MILKRELTHTEVAYLAGILDGEGCISILKMRMKRPYGVYWHYALQLRIGNTYLPLLEWICERVGGKIYAQTYVTNWRGNRKQAYHWHMQGRQAANFLALVRPYLIVKSEQADLAMEFIALGRETAPAARAEMRERMRTLNVRGIGYSTASGPASVE